MDLKNAILRLSASAVCNNYLTRAVGISKYNLEGRFLLFHIQITYRYSRG